MPDTARSHLGAGRVRASVAVLLLAGWLVGAVLATASGTVLLAPFDPCGQGSDCASNVIFVTEYAVRYGPLLLFLAVLPPAAARLMQHRTALPVLAIGVTALGILLAILMLIAAIAG